MKTQIIRSDSDYREAMNYADHPNLYNFPVTVDFLYRGKIEKKYVLGCGSSDHIETRVKGKELYILSENSGLDYISLTIINPYENTIDEAFLDNGELSYNPLNLPEGMSIFDYSFWTKVKYLSQYLNY
jgi:hypothetical protein